MVIIEREFQFKNQKIFAFGNFLLPATAVKVRER
jgi:hypothetical protein